MLKGFASSLKHMTEAVKFLDRTQTAAEHNTSRIAETHSKHTDSNQPNRESMTERAFVASFGSKVKRFRLSNRADFVGLYLAGIHEGILVTGDDKGNRKIRLVDIDAKGVAKVTPRYLRVKRNDSISNLQKGLLKWVR